MKIKKNKTFILGIDGATFEIIFPLMKRDMLPNMQEIMRKGANGILYSTIPSLTAPAWVALMTGRNPGHYGAYHFRKIAIKEYRDIYSQDLINSSVYRGTTVFDYLGQKGYKVGVMTVPVTYPPWEVNGFIVSGYPCPDLHTHSNYAYPPELSKELNENLNWTELGGSDKIPKAELRGASDPQDILEGGLAMMSRRTKYTLKLMKEFDCDLTILVWGAIDRSQHMLWKYHDPNHILYQPDNSYASFIEDLYCHADYLLGEIIKCIGPDAHLFIVSDHGFGPKQGSFFHVNAWLHNGGYLKPEFKSMFHNNYFSDVLKSYLRKFVINQDASTRRKIVRFKDTVTTGAINFGKTRAYRFPIDEQTGGLVINLKGRQKRGCVKEEEYEPLRAELIEYLSKFCDPRNGKPVIRDCFRREDIYSGKRVFEAPDIIFVLQEGYYTGSGNAGRLCSDIPPQYLDKINGNHRQEGIFMAYGPSISKGISFDQSSIMDVAPTVLYAMGEKIPRNMEGRVISSIFSVERLKMPPELIDYDLDGIDEMSDFSSFEQETMKKKLQNLGYL